MIRVAMGRLRGKVTAAWIDPTDGKASSVDGSPFPAAHRRGHERALFHADQSRRTFGDAKPAQVALLFIDAERWH